MTKLLCIYKLWIINNISIRVIWRLREARFAWLLLKSLVPSKHCVATGLCFNTMIYISFIFYCHQCLLLVTNKFPSFFLVATLLLSFWPLLLLHFLFNLLLLICFCFLLTCFCYYISIIQIGGFVMTFPYTYIIYFVHIYPFITFFMWLCIL